MVSKWSQNPWNIGPGPQQKTMLKNGATKINNIPKMTSKLDPKRDSILRVLLLVAPLVAQTAFVIKKCSKNGPQALAKCAQERKMSQKWLPRTPRLWKRAQKRTPSVKQISQSGPFSDQGPADCAKRLQYNSTLFFIKFREASVLEMLQQIWRKPYLFRGYLRNDKLCFDCAGASGSRVGPSKKPNKSEGKTTCEQTHLQCRFVCGKVAQTILTFSVKTSPVFHCFKTKPLYSKANAF